MRFHLSCKSHFGVQCFLYVHMNWDEMKLKPVWISYRSFWPKWNFILAWDFHVNKIYPKWISPDSLDIALNVHVHLKITAGMDFISVNFREMEFHFGWLIKYHVNTTRNEIPTHVHQNIELFWNVAELKPNVNLFSHRFEIRP